MKSCDVVFFLLDRNVVSWNIQMFRLQDKVKDLRYNIVEIIIYTYRVALHSLDNRLIIDAGSWLPLCKHYSRKKSRIFEEVTYKNLLPMIHHKRSPCRPNASDSDLEFKLI